MPEGPEVLRCGNQLSGIIKGRTLHQLKPLSGKLSRQMQPIDFGCTVTDVLVKGKSIFIQLEDGQEIFSSLGMSGWWYPPPSEVDSNATVYHQGKMVPINSVVEKAMKHARVELIVDGPSAFYLDPRNFGNLKVITTYEANKLRASLGVELLTAQVDGNAALAAIKSQGKREIGEVLLDQSIVCGLGNIYRAETLYIAGVNPFRMCSSLTTDELTRIITVAANVLSIAFHYQGTLIYPVNFLSDFLRELTFEPEHDMVRGPMVYGRAKDLFGHEVNRSKSAGRTLWWVPIIQT